METCIGCDIGGSYVKIGLISRNGTILYQRTVPLPPLTTPEEMADWISSLLLNFYTMGKKLHTVPIGVGIGIPGPLQYPEGILHDPPNLPFSGEIPMRQFIEERISLPVIMDNDATTQTLGELWLGEGIGIKNLIYLSFGTGIGGGIVIDGKVYRGTIGLAGEIGHMTIDYHGRPCLCGARGCLETYASLNGLAQSLLEWKDPLPHDLTMALRSKDYGSLPALLKDKIESGEVQWQRIWDIFADALGAGIGSLINLFNPQKVVLSGGLSYYSNLFLPRTLEKIHTSSFRGAAKGCLIRISKLKNTSGIIGAAHLAFTWEENKR